MNIFAYKYMYKYMYIYAMNKARSRTLHIYQNFSRFFFHLVAQDGKEAGQTVPHVHIHILPRRKGDFEKNDEVYDAIDANSKENAAARNGGGEPLNLDKERKARSIDEMAKEAATLSSLF